MIPPSTAPRRILVVEDDAAINEAVTLRLRAVGYVVEQAWDGPAAVAACAQTPPDAAVVDVMLPGYDGLEVCRRIQADRPVPVLMLTARDEESDVLAGLAAGADDYLTKPFGMRELVARVAALLRRVDRAPLVARERGTRVLVAGSLACDPGTRRVTVDGVEVALTPTQFDLLACLASTPGQVWSRDRLLADVWDWPDALAGRGGTRTVDSHVKSLRVKIGAHRLRTVHGVGYALEAG